MANLNIRIDDKLKKDVESILYSLGLSSSDAVRIYFNQIRNNSGIPFKLKLHQPTEMTVKAMEETMNDIREGAGKPYDNADELMNDLLSDEVYG